MTGVSGGVKTKTEYSKSVADIIKEDMENIINENGVFATLIQITTTTDSQGGVTSNSENSIPVKFIQRPLSSKDRELDTQGILEQGDTRGIFKHKYTVDKLDYRVSLGDIIKIGESNRFRIVSVTDSGKLGLCCFKKAVLRKLI